MKINRICCICGRGYSYCPACGEDAGKPTWYFIFDGENCHDIYETCVAYRDKEIDQKEAYERISKLDVSNMKNFAEATQAQIKEILNYKEETKPTDGVPKMVYKNKNMK